MAFAIPKSDEEIASFLTGLVEREWDFSITEPIKICVMRSESDFNWHIGCRIGDMVCKYCLDCQVFGIDRVRALRMVAEIFAAELREAALDFISEVDLWHLKRVCVESDCEFCTKSRICTSLMGKYDWLDGQPDTWTSKEIDILSE